MRLAYADPPYLGQCARYGHRHEERVLARGRLTLKMADAWNRAVDRLELS